MSARSSDNPIAEKLSAYLDGELPDAERQAVEAALAEDPALAAELAALRRTAELIGQLPQRSAPHGTADLIVARLERSALLDEPVAVGGRPRTFRVVGWLAAAAVLVLCFGVGWLVMQSLRPTPTPVVQTPDRSDKAGDDDPAKQPTTLADARGRDDDYGSKAGDGRSDGGPSRDRRGTEIAKGAAGPGAAAARPGPEPDHPMPGQLQRQLGAMADAGAGGAVEQALELQLACADIDTTHRLGRKASRFFAANGIANLEVPVGAELAERLHSAVAWGRGGGGNGRAGKVTEAEGAVDRPRPDAKPDTPARTVPVVQQFYFQGTARQVQKLVHELQEATAPTQAVANLRTGPVEARGWDEVNRVAPMIRGTQRQGPAQTLALADAAEQLQRQLEGLTESGAAGRREAAGKVGGGQDTRPEIPTAKDTNATDEKKRPDALVPGRPGGATGGEPPPTAPRHAGEQVPGEPLTPADAPTPSAAPAAPAEAPPSAAEQAQPGINGSPPRRMARSPAPPAEAGRSIDAPEAAMRAKRQAEAEEVPATREAIPKALAKADSADRTRRRADDEARTRGRDRRQGIEGQAQLEQRRLDAARSGLQLDGEAARSNWDVLRQQRAEQRYRNTSVPVEGDPPLLNVILTLQTVAPAPNSTTQGTMLHLQRQ